MRVRRLLLCLAVILAAIGGADYLHRWRDQAVVVVTAAPIPAHTTITTDMLTLRRVNREAMDTTLPHAITRVEDATGLVARMDIPAGEVVRREPWLVAVTPDGAQERARYHVPDGMRLVGIRVDTPGAVAHRVAPGDRVDVIFTSKDASSGGVYSRTVLQATDVFSVDGAGKGSSMSSMDAVDITLLVTPQQAQDLALAKRLTGSLDLSITPPNPQTVTLPPTSPVAFTAVRSTEPPKR